MKSIWWGEGGEQKAKGRDSAAGLPNNLIFPEGQALGSFLQESHLDWDRVPSPACHIPGLPLPGGTAQGGEAGSDLLVKDTICLFACYFCVLAGHACF